MSGTSGGGLLAAAHADNISVASIAASTGVRRSPAIAIVRFISARVVSFHVAPIIRLRRSGSFRSPPALPGAHCRRGRSGRRRARRMFGAEVMDDLFGVNSRIDRRVDLQNMSVLADYVSYAAVQAENWNSILGAIGARDAAVGVEQQRKRQAVFFDEGLVRLGRIDTASQHRDTPNLEQRVAVAERARLLGTSGRVVLGIEVEHQ